MKTSGETKRSCWGERDVLAHTAPMIRFRAPRLERTARGSACIELTEGGSWESFGPIAEALAAQLRADIVDRVDGPEVRVWTIRLAGLELWLVYSDYPNGVSLEAKSSASSALVERLHATFLSEASPDGV